MALTNSSYLFRKVLKISVFDVEDHLKLLGSMSLFNSVNFSNESQSTDISSAGNIIARLDYGKTATLSGEATLISENILGLQAGVTVENVTNVSDVSIPDTITVMGDRATATYVATGTPDSEIGYAYLIDNQGSPIKTFKQDAVAGPGTFSYSATTNELVFDAGEVPDGTKVLINTYPTISSAKLIINNSDKFAMSGYITCDILAADPCNLNNEFLFKLIIPNGKFSGTYSWDISGTDAPVQAFEITSMLPCGVNELWRAYVFDEEDVLKYVNP
jgi:hypothetical protein